MRVVGVLPTLGRLEAILELIPRLVASAAYALELHVIVDGRRSEYDAIFSRCNPQQYSYNLHLDTGGRGYWSMMSTGANYSSAELIVNLANDLLPGREWLHRAVLSYKEQFGKEYGVLGLWDGVHDRGEHCGHFIAHREFLRGLYGDALYPTDYFHLFGDTEIVARAKQMGLWAVEPWAALFHNHPATGAQTDEVYRTAHQRYWRDKQIYEQRAANNWN